MTSFNEMKGQGGNKTIAIFQFGIIRSDVKKVAINNKKRKQYGGQTIYTNLRDLPTKFTSVIQFDVVENTMIAK